MAAPVPTLSATVNVGVASSYMYVGSYRGMNCYLFYRGTTRWMCLQRLRIDPDLDSKLAMAYSNDDGQTWSITDGPVRDGGDIGAPSYDIRVASGMTHGLVPANISSITALYAKTSTSPSERHLAYVDFDFAGNSWG